MATGSSPSKPHVVVIGGGYGGNQIALSLKKNKISFTLIDARAVMHHNMAAVRAAVVPGFCKKTLIPFEPTFGANFKLGRVVGIDPKEKKVHVEGGDEVPYDILVIATGTTGPFPGKLADETTLDHMTNRYDCFTEKMRSSTKILLIGGGAVGVEIAGEIATQYPDKEVTLIHNSTRLVREGLSDGFQNRLKEILRQLGVKIIYDETVSNMDDLPDLGAATVTTEKGTAVDADLIIKCIGLRINSEGYSEGLGTVMNANGALQVNEYLQVSTHDKIFTLGDCCASGAPWMALHAGEQAKIVFENIKRTIKGSKLKSYKPGTTDKGGMIVLSVGRSNAIGQLASGRRIPEFILKKLKSSDLFVGRFWGQMKQKPPA